MPGWAIGLSVGVGVQLGVAIFSAGKLWQALRDLIKRVDVQNGRIGKIEEHEKSCEIGIRERVTAVETELKAERGYNG